MGRVTGVDGIKTGYTRAAGYNLVSSVRHKRRSIVAVVMGGRSGKRRNDQMQRLISRYLPKASRGKQRRLVAKRKSSGNSFAVAQVNLPRKGPVPTQRHRTVSAAQNRIIAAHATQTALATNVVPVNRKSEDAIRQRLLELSGKEQKKDDDRVAAPRPPTKIDRVTTASLKESDKSGKPRGWIIQIGATDSKQQAEALLGKAKNALPKMLADVSTYTETTTKKSSTLHRARFSGFSGKTEARRACKALKRRKFACLALKG